MLKFEPGPDRGGCVGCGAALLPESYSEDNMFDGGVFNYDDIPTPDMTLLATPQRFSFSLCWFSCIFVHKYVLVSFWCSDLWNLILFHSPWPSSLGKKILSLTQDWVRASYDGLSGFFTISLTLFLFIFNPLLMASLLHSLTSHDKSVSDF